MKYQIELKPRAVKDLLRLPRQEAARVADALEKLANDLIGDVKKLTNILRSTDFVWVSTGFYSKWKTRIT